jgi:ATP-dependent exoDNAse (exonuclease V) beta subunit
LINSIFQLKIKGFSNHPDLFLFTSFADLKEYADSPMGGDLKAVLKLIETYGRERLLNILESTTESAEEASVTITTAHKSKGLEWSVVKLANDFKLPSEGNVPTQEETNILYVAASRALHKLDLSECMACFPQTLNDAVRINKEKQQLVEIQFKETVSNNIKDLQKEKQNATNKTPSFRDK